MDKAISPAIRVCPPTLASRPNPRQGPRTDRLPPRIVCGEKDQSDCDQNDDINNRVQYSRDFAYSFRILRAVPFKALVDRDQLDNARGTKRKAHEKERIYEGEIGHFRQAR